MIVFACVREFGAFGILVVARVYTCILNIHNHVTSLTSLTVINPRRACAARVTVLGLSIDI